MESHHFSKQKSAKQRAQDQEQCYYDELTTSLRSPVQSPLQSSCVASNVFEVTSNKGGVGFVAVGRRFPGNQYSNHTGLTPTSYKNVSVPSDLSILNDCTQTNSQIKTSAMDFSVENRKSVLSFQNGAIHMRHQSEPLLDFSYQQLASNTIPHNSDHMPLETQSTPKHQTEKIKKASNREKKRKTQVQHLTDNAMAGMFLLCIFENIITFYLALYCFNFNLVFN